MIDVANLKDVEDAIKSFNIEEKRQLISDLPKLLQLSPEDLDLLKLAEPAFQFWDNSDDSIYDSL